MTLVAIIEDDAAFATELRTAVESAGFQTDLFAGGAAALPDVRRQAFALAIVDLGIRDTDPFAVCSEASRLMPVIALTTSPGEEACVRAFQSGVDDCLVRPFAARELQARIHNVLRRAGSRHQDHDELALAVSTMRVRNGDEIHDLSHGEAEILAILLASRGSPLTVLQLLDRLPPRSRVKRGTVESRIKNLRRKLAPGRLVSRGRFGYQLADD